MLSVYGGFGPCEESFEGLQVTAAELGAFPRTEVL